MIRQLKEKYLAKVEIYTWPLWILKRHLMIALGGHLVINKSCCRIPEWIIAPVKDMHNNTKVRVRADYEHKDVFPVIFDVYQV